MSALLVGAIRPRGSPEQRFWAKVEKSDGCWQWIGARDRSGYGRFTSFPSYGTLAHRISFAICGGVLVTGLEMDHLCRNRGCVRPDHLEQVSHLENVRRGEGSIVTKRLRAARTHCKWGHAFTGSNVHNYLGKRICRECRRRRKAVYLSTQKKVD